MKKYDTGPRKALLAFLKEHYYKPFSIEEIAQMLCSDEDISVSSVYRNINKMVQEGTVKRFSADGSRKFLYQFLDRSDCRGHMHLKCEGCGLLFHMESSAMAEILSSAMQRCNFSIDVGKTVLYGSCKNCV